MQLFDIIGPGPSGYKTKTTKIERPAAPKGIKTPIVLKGNGNFEDCIVPLTLSDEQYQDAIEEKPSFEETIIKLCNNMADFLIAKNTKYGNSALEPLQIFSHSSSGDQLNNRIDDKLSRIKNSEEPRKNDIVDLIGYLHLKLIDEGWTDFQELID